MEPKNMKCLLFTFILLCFLILQSNLFAQSGATFKQWGEETLSAIERDFRVQGSALYKENLTSSYAYNWPQGIQFHALVAAGKIAQAEALANEAHTRYWCFKNNIWAYNAATGSCGSRFYDDNAWMAKGLMELYEATNNATYLNRAKEVLNFVMSGEFAASSDPMRTTGSIRWDEGANNWCLCASAPAATSNLMVYQATGDTKYLNDGRRIYNWAKTNRWGIGGGYRGYENAVLCQAAILLFKATNDQVYYDDAKSIGLKMETHYIDWTSHSLHETGQWGGHDMTNAYVDLYELDKDVNWLNIAAGYLSFLHNNCKDGSGRYPEGWADAGAGGNASLLYQAPAACAYARMGSTPGGVAKHPDPVALFRDCNYNADGWNAGLFIGGYTLADLIFLGIPDNDISSVKVQPGYRIILYENDNFTGATVTLTSDNSCLVANGWNDRATSLVVEAVSPNVIVYKDCNYTGRAVSLPVGSYTLAQLQARGVNNEDISSLRVSSGFKMEAFENDNFSDAAITITAHNSCLVANGWNDKITSLRVSTNCTGTAIVPYLSVNGGTAQQVSNATLSAGGSVKLSPQPTTGGSWNWTGPGSFTSTAREVTINNIQVNQGGTYIATYTNTSGCTSTHNFVITVQPANVVNLWVDCSYAAATASLPVGDYDMNALVASGIPNDAISSMKVAAGYEVVVYQDWNFTGTSHILTGDIACLTTNSIDNWISSIRVRARTTAFSSTIQAENYSAMAGIATENTTDTGGGLNVGWVETNDWMAYANINIPSSGSYLVEYRVASPNSGGQISMDVNSGATVLGTVNVPNTGGWQNWTTISHTVTINAGTYSFGIFAQVGGWNINWWRITGATNARLISSSDEKELDNHIHLYPNPSSGVLNIKSMGNLVGAKIKIFDSKGIEIIKTDLKAEELDVSSLPPGLYSILLIKDGLRVSKHFVKK